MNKKLSIWLGLMLLFAFSMISAISNAASPVSGFSYGHKFLADGKILTPSVLVSNLLIVDLIDDTDTEDSEDQVQVSGCIEQSKFLLPAVMHSTLFKKITEPFREERQHVILCVFKI